MNSIMNFCLPPSTIVIYTSYTKADGAPQHLEVTFDTATSATVITHLQVDPGKCPLQRRGFIGRNHCRKTRCSFCDFNTLPTEGHSPHHNPTPTPAITATPTPLVASSDLSTLPASGKFCRVSQSAPTDTLQLYSCLPHGFT
jgi:hypothetical protein